MPALADHLEDLGVDLPAVTFAWFLSLYTDCLPVEVSSPLRLASSCILASLTNGHHPPPT